MSAHDTLFSLRYQVMRPAVTTMGDCPQCGESSRGSGVCADCLTESLPEDMQPFARQWKEHAEAGARSWWELERMAEKENNNG